MTTELLFTFAAFIAGFYFIKAGATYTQRLTRTAIVCVVVGLLIAAWY